MVSLFANPVLSHTVGIIAGRPEGRSQTRDQYIALQLNRRIGDRVHFNRDLLPVGSEKILNQFIFL